MSGIPHSLGLWGGSAADFEHGWDCNPQKCRWLAKKRGPQLYKHKELNSANSMSRVWKNTLQKLQRRTGSGWHLDSGLRDPEQECNHDISGLLPAELEGNTFKSLHT